MKIIEHPVYLGYGASRDGRVWSRRRTRIGLVDDWQRELKPRVRKDGHLQVGLYLGKKHVHVKVHRFVLECFVGPCPEGMECRHLDGNPANNHVDNLAWGTRSQNAADRTTHGTDNRGERHHSAKLTEADVRDIRADSRVHKAIAADYGIARTTVSNIKNGYKWKHIII